MQKLKVLDLFSGIGGFSLGLERTGGFETVAFCEIGQFCRSILASRWPGVRIHEDVQTYPFRKGEAEVIAAGWPCQDISIANGVWGNRAGLAGERSGLFREVLRAIRVVEPDYVVLENVSDLLALGMGDVLRELAALGYDVQWHCIPASAVGAPQERDRVWIIANSSRVRMPRLVTGNDLGTAGQGWPCSAEDLQFICDHPFQPGSRWPQPLFRRMDDGLPDRAYRIHALGNGLVPGIATIIGNAILATHKYESEAA